jgi:myo-inositol-1(or 4)-monophosphatase
LSYSQELFQALEAARLAAEPINKLFGNIKQAETKDDNKGIVTQADKEAESRILEYLTKNTPYGILSEETGSTGTDSGPQWVVDPLDGTTNFAQGLPLFAVSIALVEGDDLQIGVILDPLTGDEYYAEKGKGAFKNGNKLWRKENRAGQPPVLLLDHGYQIKDRKLYAELVNRFVETSYLRSLGASTVELAHIAAGNADAFICSGDELWDVAAGVLLAREAGFKTSDWQGNAWSSDSKYELICHPGYYDMVVEKIEDLQE